MQVCTHQSSFALVSMAFQIRNAKKYTGYCIIACVPIWWGTVDSNHRRHCQQIYSLSPLATREFPHIKLRCQTRWSWWTDSNPRPADYKSAALPAELHQRLTSEDYITRLHPVCQQKFSPPAGIFYINRHRHHIHPCTQERGGS